tara:strand:+ start:96 stop:731 length:636 start_codon:yes stop_codon:yes gene_type:complete
MSIVQDQFNRPGEAATIGMHLPHSASMRLVKGEVFIEMVDAASGELLHKEHRQNVITLDAGILAAILLRDPNSRTHGFNMLSVGTGATGAVLSPDAPDSRQRKLNAEIARKPFSSTTFRDASGAAVAIPTNIVDYTCTFDESEAVGPLNEMGIQSTISANPAVTNPNPDVFPNRVLTRDLTTLDILCNYLTFGVITKPNTARLTITWRITH